MKYEKGSFIVVPNVSSVMGVSSSAQCLYMWLCFYAGQDGNCFPSRSTLANKMNCSVRSVDEYLKELVSADLVKKENRHRDNEKISNNYYLPLWGGRANSALPRANSALPLGQILPIELNPVLTQSNNISEIGISQVIEEDVKPKKPPRYPNARRVFDLFPNKQPGWNMNTTELRYAELLYEERGLEDIEEAIEYIERHRDEPFFPTIDKPSELYNKWSKLITNHTKRYGKS